MVLLAKTSFFCDIFLHLLSTNSDLLTENNKIMKTKPTFDELMLLVQQPLQEFEARQDKKKRRRLIRRSILYSLMLICVIIGCLADQAFNSIILGGVFVITEVFLSYFFRKTDGAISGTVIPTILNGLLGEGAYKARKGIPENVANQNTSLTDYDKYSSFELIEGSVGKAFYSIANIRATKKAKDMEDPDDVVFLGVMFVANIAKRYDTRITVWVPALVKKNEDQLLESAKEPSDTPVPDDEFAEVWEVITEPIRNVLISLPEDITRRLRIELYGHQFMITVSKPYLNYYSSTKKLVASLEKDYKLITAFTTIADDLNSNSALWG